MYLRPEDRARPSRMALRIAVVGGFAVALFAILFFRLWTLQVIDGSSNLAEAKNNRTRSTKIIAPRGKILARNGEVLVDNRTSLALQVDPDEAARRPGRRSGRAEGNRRTRAHETAAGGRSDRRRRESRRRRRADHAAPRRRLRPHLLHRRTQGEVPRRRGGKGLRPQLPGRRRGRRSSSATPARSTKKSWKKGRTRGPNRAKSSARKGSSTPTTRCCGGRRGSRATR